MKRAYFSGGDPRILVFAFNKRPGIENIRPGFFHTENISSYDEALENDSPTGVEVVYDSRYCSYDALLDIYFEFIDPTNHFKDANYNLNAYAPIIHTQNAKEYDAAKAFKGFVQSNVDYGAPLDISLKKRETFYASTLENLSETAWRALLKNHGVERARDYYKPFKQSRLKNSLPKLSYLITQQDYTESPFQNPYHDNDQVGIYVDVVSGEPLFTTNEQYDSGCGWPSFTAPIERLTVNLDTSMGMRREEVRSNRADSHLGHVFDDGPKEAGGLRYCINSAALRFIPVESLEKEGYGEYLKYFKK